MKKVLLLLVAVMLVLQARTDAEGAFKFGVFAKAYYGYESNIFKSPDVINVSGADTYPVTADSFINYGAGMKLDYLATKYDKFELDYNSDFNNYFAHSISNNYDHSLTMKYTRKLDPARVKIKAYADKAVKLEADTLGDGLTRNYAYYRVSAGPEFEYKFSRDASAGVSYALLKKNYEETAGAESLDYLQHEIKLDGSIRLEDGKIIGALETDIRNYASYLASDASGNTLAGNPKKQYNYYKVKAGYEHWFAGKKGTKAVIEYNFEMRSDMFEGYYSYMENGVGLKADIVMSDATGIELDAGYDLRNYLTLQASVPDSNPLMIKAYITAGAKVTQKLGDYIEISAEYLLDMRDTNVENTIFKTSRDYIDHVITAGVKAEY